MVKQIGSIAEFDALLAENVDKLVLVDFFATWCGPCVAIAPKLAKLAEKYSDIVVVKVDVDEQAELSGREKITCMPTFKFYKGNTLQDTLEGASEAKLEELINKHK